MNDGLLAGKRAVVTGAARGIGEATARRFCEEGAGVVLTDIDLETVKSTAGALQAAGHEAEAMVLDVVHESSVESALSSAAKVLGGLDTIVANAGVLTVAPILEADLESFERTLSVNLVGAFLTLKHGVPHLRRNGGGVLLCTASQAGLRGWPELSSYCASKFGVVGLVESLAQELAADNIRVCAVAPGLTETAMQKQLIEERSRIWDVSSEEVTNYFNRTLPFGRPASPEEVANAFVYLASPLAAYVSGVTLPVDGAELSG